MKKRILLFIILSIFLFTCVSTGYKKTNYSKKRFWKKGRFRKNKLKNKSIKEKQNKISKSMKKLQYNFKKIGNNIIKAYYTFAKFFKEIGIEISKSDLIKWLKKKMKK